MIWAILAMLGVPLWLCAIGILTVVFSNRKLRKRPGDIPVRVKAPGKKRWVRGHAIWVSDVFAWRGSPASWNEDLVHAVDVTVRPPTADEQHTLRHLGDDLTIAVLNVAGGDPLEVAVTQQQQTMVLGPFHTLSPEPA